MALSQHAANESGTNLTRVKDFNESVVLDLVRSRGEITRPEIATATALTLQTVANITRRLLSGGLLEETHAPAGGRPRRTLSVNHDAAYAIGIQLDRPGFAVALVNLAGEIKARATSAIDRDEAPEQVVARMAMLAREVSDGVDGERILGAGIGAPGPLDLRQGKLLGPLAFTGWDHFPLRQVVADALGMRVIMDNDATAAALGEHWRGAGNQNFVYLYLARGLGAGLIAGGQAFRGHRGNAGEISHIQVNPSGAPCDCGSNGCLGLYATPEAIGDDPEKLATAAALLAKVVEDLARVLDPELIVLGGPQTEHLGPAYAKAIEARLEPPPRVELSQIGSDAGVIGAATLILHDLYAPTLGKLSL
jgi:predicted NBD/HSP70 family sugar kinase